MSHQNLTQLSPAALSLAPRWVFWWSVLTVSAVFPLLTLGAEVTTKGVGMVDPDGRTHLREPLVLVRQWQEGSLAERGLGYVIEHGHRLAGLAVGVCVIVLALGLGFGARPVWLKTLGVAALLAVVGQGLLGVFRVDLHARLGPALALIHGCTAQLVLALLVSIAVVLSPGWSRPVPRPPYRWLALALMSLVYVQLVLGALVRHNFWPDAARLHLLTAFLVVAGVIWLAREVVAGGRGFVAIGLLGVAVAVQLWLGLEAWITKFNGGPVTGWGQLTPLGGPGNILRSLHYVTGSLVYALTVLITLKAWSGSGNPGGQLTAGQMPAREFEGVA